LKSKVVILLGLLDPWTMGQAVSHETLAVYQSTSRDIPEERRPLLYRVASL